MNSSLAFLLVVATLSATPAHARAKMKKYIWLHDIKSCSSDIQEAYINTSFRYAGQGAFYLNIDAFTPWKFEHLYLFVDLLKCPTKIKTEDCEKMMSFPAGDQCILDKAYFRGLYGQFTPTISCPIMGHYQAKDAILDSEMYSLFFQNLGDEEWLHSYIDIYSDEKRQEKKVCVLVIATMRKVRVEDGGNRKRKH